MGNYRNVTKEGGGRHLEGDSGALSLRLRTRLRHLLFVCFLGLDLKQDDNDPMGGVLGQCYFPHENRALIVAASTAAISLGILVSVLRK